MSGFDMSFYKGKKVLVTGHTGFKGSWLCKVLSMYGADAAGYALEPPTVPSLFEISKADRNIKSVIGDIRDRDRLISLFKDFRPEIVFHLAAQPIVREGYKNPAYTYEVNVMGTVNVCEAVRFCGSVKSFVNVTTDKVYKLNESKKVRTETDPLDGFDPYSNSKSCSELVTSSYNNSFFRNSGIAVSTCRAGNAIGGGDFAKDRIIPDCIRAAEKNEKIIIRNPHAIRPFQHVLEPVIAYLIIAAEQYKDIGLSGSYNIGPDEQDCITAGELADLFCRFCDGNAGWEKAPGTDSLYEADSLKLDCSKFKKAFNRNPQWHIEEAVKRTVEWYCCYSKGGDVNSLMKKQISEYTGE